jgi:hypothetical protein
MKQVSTNEWIWVRWAPKATVAVRPSSALLCVPIFFSPQAVLYLLRSTVSYTAESRNSRLISQNVSTMFYYAEVHLYKCNGNWVVTINQNMNFNFHPAATFAHVLKMILFKVVHPLNIYEHTKFNDPMLTIAPTSEIWRSTTLQRMEVRN